MFFHLIEVLLTTIEKEECSLQTIKTVYSRYETLSQLGPTITGHESKSLDCAASFKTAIKKWKPTNCLCRLFEEYYLRLALCN